MRMCVRVSFHGGIAARMFAHATLTRTSTVLPSRVVAEVCVCVCVCVCVYTGNKPSVAGGLTDSQDTVSALATALQQAGALPQGVCTAVKTARLTLLDPWYTGDHGNSDNRMYT